MYVELACKVANSLKATLPVPVPDLKVAINPAVFPTDAQLQPSSILKLPDKAALTALAPKPDFFHTLFQLNPPRILLRPHHCALLKDLRVSLENKAFSGNAISVYGAFSQQKQKALHLMIILFSAPASSCFLLRL